MDSGGNHTCSRRDRHAYEVLFARPARVGRLRIDLNVEARQTASAGDQKKEAGKQPQMPDPIHHGTSLEIRQHKPAKAPHQREQRRRHAKRNGIGQGIELAAKIAGCSGHPRDKAIQSVGDDGNAYCLRCYIEVSGFRLAAEESVIDCKIARAHVCCRKQGGQNVHAFAHAAALSWRKLIIPAPLRSFHRTASDCSREPGAAALTARRARTEEPPFTRSPTLTWIWLGTGKRTSVRDANLISPTRCPRDRASPGL